MGNGMDFFSRRMSMNEYNYIQLHNLSEVSGKYTLIVRLMKCKHSSTIQSKKSTFLLLKSLAITVTGSEVTGLGRATVSRLCRALE